MDTVDRLVLRIESLTRKQKTLLIAIDGRGGSGKSTLARKIQERLNNVESVNLDDFHSPGLGRADRDRLIEQVITPLKNDRPAKYQRFDWGTKKLAEWHNIAPGGIVIIEGVSPLHDDFKNSYDLAVWIECPAEVGFQRGVERDMKKYGVDTEKDWLETWMPQEKRYIEEQKPREKADLVINYLDLES